MFFKTKIKIIATIMSAVTLTWLGTMFVIYCSYLQDVSKKNYELLVERADMYVSKSFIEDNTNITSPPEKNDKHVSSTSELTTFYTVAFSDDGETFETMNDKPALHSNEELEEIATKIVYEYEHDIGFTNGLIYYHINKGSYDLVVFIDNALILDRLATLTRYFWLYSAGAFIFFLMLSIVIANIIVRPLQKGYKRQKRFISDAGHELKTPVSVINANTELLSREIGENHWLANIQHENERMSLLIGHLLELAHSDKIPKKMENVDFSYLVSREALPFESVAYEKGLNLLCDIAPNLSIYGDDEQLTHIVSVLLDNAIQHCDNKSPDIRIELKKDFCKYAKLRVINSGEKISKEEREHIFDRFYQTKSDKNRNNNHYGLGLSIAKNIVTSHKGKIYVLCYDGKVEFKVLLPLTNPRQKRKKH